MRPVDQTIFELGRGNCLAACVASLLELNLSDVPNFRELAGERGRDADILDPWLAQRGLRAIRVQFSTNAPCSAVFFGASQEPLIAWGVSPRREKGGPLLLHAVVARANGWGLTLVHDPHPSREGVGGDYLGCCWIVKE